MNKIKNGFTLIELLVVVLIIGILAAIALPQYKLAVAKSKYATLKNVTKSIKESVDRFYLTNGTYPTTFEDLDIDFKITSQYNGSGNSSFYIVFPNVKHCEIYHIPSNHNIICSKTILGKTMQYTQPAFPWTYRACTSYSTDTEDISNKVCQAETGKTAKQAICSSSFCYYYY